MLISQVMSALVGKVSTNLNAQQESDPLHVLGWWCHLARHRPAKTVCTYVNNYIPVFDLHVRSSSQHSLTGRPLRLTQLTVLCVTC